jgi:hypothetical protein
VKTTLVSIPTETVPLDGAWHEPEGTASGAALLFHGNTMNFYRARRAFCRRRSRAWVSPASLSTAAGTTS